MFRRLPDPNARLVSFTFEGQPAQGVEGDSVAAALLALGHSHCRDSVVSGAARGPHCLMGACFECLVSIDGAANRQGCMTRLREGMAVARQRGRRDVGP
jgi:predicted molibdopterin-dependent oxidoreductase YjgC